ncbi:hypothetical protein G6F61_010545 [Rhizopus arrhizus]|nr:hypothetical protein G6F42_026082 [Rhizopus arrhizus]KAG1373012.1 hypothetical protein G6F61_010545 [Rhizopus arrhizus]
MRSVLVFFGLLSVFMLVSSLSLPAGLGDTITANTNTDNLLTILDTKAAANANKALANSDILARGVSNDLGVVSIATHDTSDPSAVVIEPAAVPASADLPAPATPVVPAA